MSDLRLSAFFPLRKLCSVANLVFICLNVFLELNFIETYESLYLVDLLFFLKHFSTFLCLFCIANGAKLRFVCVVNSKSINHQAHLAYR